MGQAALISFRGLRRITPRTDEQFKEIDFGGPKTEKPPFETKYTRNGVLVACWNWRVFVRSTLELRRHESSKAGPHQNEGEKRQRGCRRWNLLHVRSYIFEMPVSQSTWRPTFSRQPMWLAGQALVVLDSVFDVISYGLAPQTVLAPLGAMTLV